MEKNLQSAAEAEVAQLCAELIRIRSENYGTGEGPGEREVAEYVVGRLQEVGYDPIILESEPGRASVFLNVPGADQTRPAMVVHGHLDVVPADAKDWQVDPYEGVIQDGMVWGRGAVDMKDMDAVFLAVLRQRARENRPPARNLIVAFFADEEAGGLFGANWWARRRPELFAGATEAVSEVGGFSVTVNGRRAYLLQTAEKGIAWLRLIAEGTAGHGSAINRDNALVELTKALNRIIAEPWPIRLQPAVQELLQGVADLTGLKFDPRAEDSIREMLEALGPSNRFVGSSISTVANLTQLHAGYKTNVIPGQASATIDVRPLPGDEAQVFARIQELVGPKVRIEPEYRTEGISAPASGPLYQAMSDSLLAADPQAVVLPYMLSGGTDNKPLAGLGITGYGFAPLQLPAELDFTAMFHGVDERVPVASLQFGARVFDDFLDRI